MFEILIDYKRYTYTLLYIKIVFLLMLKFALIILTSWLHIYEFLGWQSRDVILSKVATSFNGK